MIGSIGGSLKENIRRAKVLLLPYCAKPAWCDYRYTDDCGECGGCNVGELYRIARERDMIPITITSFEMLRDTLRWCAENGYTYIGHCCYEFYEKRYEIFSRAKEWGAGGVLLDILGTTCYSLGVEEEEKAYHGEFQVELDIPLEDSEKILSLKEVRARAETPPESVPEPVEALRHLIPESYEPPRALPAPAEDRLPFRGDGSSWKRDIQRTAQLLKEAERPVLILGPLVLWSWSAKTERIARLIRELVDALPRLHVLVLPDYRPRSGKFDPLREVDPPNPHLSVLHGGYDLVLIVGVHCYRMDFFVRTIKKHTSAKVVTACFLAGHSSADASVADLDENRLRELLESLGSRSEE